MGGLDTFLLEVTKKVCGQLEPVKLLSGGATASEL